VEAEVLGRGLEGFDEGGEALGVEGDWFAEL
jgi:hypothetical protein